MLIDTSAWVEFLRATGSPTHFAVRKAIADDADIWTCEPVTMEVLAGGRSEHHVTELRRLLARATLIRTTATDWEEAARIYRAGRRQGLTIRTLVDCLIASIAMRVDQPLLHNDADFESVAQVTALRVVRE